MANDINQVILVGRLTRDAELRYSGGGMAVCKFSLAVNRRKRSGEQWVDEANFFDVAYFGKAAEAVNQYLQKGKQVAVQGELRQNRWEQDGQPRSKVEIAANNVQLLGGAGGSGGSGGNYQQRGGQQGSGNYGSFNSPAPQESSAPSVDFEDDIPF